MFRKVYIFFLSSIIVFVVLGLVLGITEIIYNYNYVNGECNVISYSIVSGDNCPWPDECQKVYCVAVYTLWYPDNSNNTHRLYISPQSSIFSNMNGCWVSETHAQITKTLNQHYPITKNHTCYSTGPGAVYFYDKHTTDYINKLLTTICITSLCLAVIGIVCMSILYTYEHCKFSPKYSILKGANPQ